MSDIDWKAENAKKTAAVEEAHREIERLRAALRRIADHELITLPTKYDHVRKIAKEALKDD